jgi:acyl dehydratase
MLEVNSKYEEEILFTQDQVKQFAIVSGDNNPIHLDNEYAKTTIFKTPIIHGMLAASSFSRILGTKFPGEGTIYRKQSLSFMAPMFVDETYRIVVTITEIDNVKGSAKLDTVIFNSKNETVLSGEAIIYNNKFKGN